MMNLAIGNLMLFKILLDRIFLQNFFSEKFFIIMSYTLKEVPKLSVNSRHYSPSLNLSPNHQITEISSISSLDMLEMQEEEKYINNLRQQRLKIEQFQKEVSKKDIKIHDMELEIQQLKLSLTNLNKQADEYSALALEVKAKDEENYSLRNQIKKQVEDYDYSLKELQAAALKEREEKLKEIRSLTARLNQKSAEIQDLKQNLIGLQSKLTQDKQSEYAKESEQAKNWKSFERMLKDQVSELAHEKNLLQDQVTDLKAQLEVFKSLPADKYSPEILKKTSGIKLKLKQKCEELKIVNKNNDDYKSRVEFEMKSLRSELERAVTLVERQENTMIELRMRKHDDDITISNLSDMISTKENELQRISSLYESLQREADDTNSKFELISHIETLKKENQLLLAQLLEQKAKDRQFKQERKQISKLKLNLMNQRNAEVNKLTHVLDAVISNIP